MDDFERIADMFQPVRCAGCGGVYDLGKVEVTARYVDCSVWKAPCCGRVSDDRGETGWKSFHDYYRIDKATGLTAQELQLRNRMWLRG